MGLLGKLTGADAAKKQAKEARKQAARKEAGSLAQLTPEALRGLMQQFFSQYMSLLGPSIMGGQQGVGASAARAGLTGSGLSRNIAAGIPGLAANKALGMASEQSIDIGKTRAGIVSERPIITNPARNGLTDLVDLAMQYYTGGGMSTGSTQQQMKVF